MSPPELGSLLLIIRCNQPSQTQVMNSLKLLAPIPKRFPNVPKACTVRCLYLHSSLVLHLNSSFPISHHKFLLAGSRVTGCNYMASKETCGTPAGFPSQTCLHAKAAPQELLSEWMVCNLNPSMQGLLQSYFVLLPLTCCARNSTEVIYNRAKQGEMTCIVVTQQKSL